MTAATETYVDLWAHAVRRMAFTFDKFADAQKFADLMLQGSRIINRVCIIGVEDAPATTFGLIGADGLFIRARDVVEGNWFLITRANELQEAPS